MLTDLDADDKLRLVRFLCAFAWADLEIAETERTFIVRLVDKMGLPAADAAKAKAWLEFPPNESDLDPNDIPEAHRKLFLDAVTEIIHADGVVDDPEVESFALLLDLFSPEGDSEGAEA